jgi:hypothetical protein
VNAVTEQDMAHAKELNEAHIARLDEALQHLRELGASQRTGDQLAVETALTSAKELALGHNGLIRKMDKQGESFATKEEVNSLRAWQAKIAGGMLALAFIGISNLVKVWGG